MLFTAQPATDTTQPHSTLITVKRHSKNAPALSNL